LIHEVNLDRKILFEAIYEASKSKTKGKESLKIFTMAENVCDGLDPDMTHSSAT
jgi:hypothetical protein